MVGSLSYYKGSDLRSLHSGLLAADSFKNKAAALTALCEYLSEPSNQLDLTTNTSKLVVSHTDIPKGTLTWIDIVKASLRAINMKSTSTFSMTKLTMWTDFKNLISISETYGKFLCSPGFLNVLLSFLISSFQDCISHANQARLLVPIVDLIKLVLSPVEYQAEISEKNYSDLFAIFSKNLLTLCSNQDTKDPFSAEELQFGRSSPKSCVQVIYKVLLSYPYDIYPFLEDDVFPFFLKFFKLKPKDCPSSGEAIQSLVCVLRSHALSATLPFTSFFNDVLPFISDMIINSSHTFLGSLIELAQVGLDVFFQIGELQNLIESRRACLSEIRSAILESVANLDVQANAVYHNCGINIVLSLNSHRLSMIRLAATLLNLIPIEIFDPDVAEEISRSPPPSKRRRVAAQCAWTNVFSCDPIPLPSLWLLFVYICNHHAQLSISFIDRILTRLASSIKQWIGMTVSCELTLTWLTACTRVASDAYRLSSPKPWPGSEQLLTVVLGWPDIFNTKSISLSAQVSRLLLSLITESTFNIESEIGSKLRQKNSTIDPFSALLLAVITQGADKQAIERRQERCSFILASLVDYNEPIINNELVDFELVSLCHQFQAECIQQALLLLIGNSSSASLKMSFSELLESPLPVLRKDEELGFIDFQRKWLPASVEQITTTIKLSHPGNPIASLLDNDILQLISQSMYFSFTQLVRILQLTYAVAPGCAPDLIQKICSYHIGKITEISNADIFSLHHLKSIILRYPGNDSFLSLYEPLVHLLSIVCKRLENLFCQPRSAGYSLVGAQNDDKYVAAIVVICEILKLVGCSQSLEEYGLPLFRCQAFRAAYAVLNCCSQSASTFLEVVRDSGLSSVGRNLCVINMSISILPQVLRSSKSQAAVQHYNNMIKRVRFPDSPEIVENELPRSSRIVFFKAGSAFIDFYKNKPADEFDPDEITLEGCADLCYSVRYFCGSYAITSISNVSTTVQLQRLFISKFFNWLNDSLSDSQGPDHGRIVTILKTATELAKVIDFAVQPSFSILCQASLRSYPLCSRTIANRCLSDLGLHFGQSPDRILSCDFEEIFSIFLDCNNAPSLDLIKQFPLELFISNSGCSPSILDLDDIPLYFAQRVISSLHYVDQCRGTKLVDALLYNNRKASKTRRRVESFLCSRILIMIQNKKSSLPIRLPKSLLSTDTSSSVTDPNEIMLGIIQGLSLREPFGIAPDNLPEVFNKLSSQFRFDSVAQLYLSPDESGRTVYNLLVSFRHLFADTCPWQSFRLTNLVRSLAVLAAASSFQQCLIIPAILQQFLSVCIWVAFDLKQHTILLPTIRSFINNAHEKDETLLEPFHFDLWSVFQLAETRAPEWLEAACRLKGSLSEELGIFLLRQPEQAIVRSELVNQIRLRRLLQVISDRHYSQQTVQDSLWSRVLHELAFISGNLGQKEKRLATRALGSVSIFLGQSKFQRLFHTSRIYTKNAMDIAERNRTVLSHLCSSLQHPDPEIVSLSVACLETIVGGKPIETLNTSHPQLLTPFCKVTFAPQRTDKFDSKMIRIPEDHAFSSWISELSSLLCLASEDDILRSMHKLVLHDPMTAELIFPHLIIDKVSAAAKTGKTRIENPIVPLLLKLFNSIAKQASDPANGLRFGKSLTVALSALLQICHQRMVVEKAPWRASQSRGSKSLNSASNISALESGFNMLNFAEACVLHSRHSTAFFFLTLWAETRTADCVNGLASLLTSNGDFSRYDEDHLRFNRLLIRACSFSLDSDLLYGACVNDFSEESDRLLYRHQGDWVRALQTHSNAVTSSFNGAPEHLHGVQESLRNLHCYSLLKSFAEPSSPFFYESAWNSADWSIDVDTPSLSNFNEHIYCTFQGLVLDKDRHYVDFVLLKAHDTVAASALSFDEHSALANVAVDQLAVLALLDDAVHTGQLPALYNDDQSDYVQGVSNALLLVRSEPNEYRSHCIKMCSRAIEIGSENLAMYYLHRTRQIEQVVPDLQFNMNHAKLLWLQGQHARAIFNMSHLVDSSRGENDQDLIADGNLCIAQWAAHAQSHEYDFINDRFIRALSAKACGSGHFHFASFQDKMLQQMLDKEHSTEDQRFAELHSARALELNQLKQQVEAQSGRQSDETVKKLKFYIRSLELQFNEDEALLERCRVRVATLAQQAVQNYIVCLQLHNQHDLQALFRLISIWFSLYQRLPSISKLILKELKLIDSAKFLPLFVQISSRLQTVKDPLQNNLDALDPTQLFHSCIYQLALYVLSEHPHVHSYAIIALRNLERVPGKDQLQYDMNTNKQQSASSLLCTLAQQSPPLGAHISAQLKLSEAYIELCSKKWASKQTRIDLKTTTLGKLPWEDLRLVCAPTRGLPLSFRDNYVDALETSYSIVSFDRYAEFSKTGLSRPIILTFTCADGTKHQELIKPNDDLRQDAVMEQVFDLVNTLLRHNNRASRNGLEMRTYNVVPLTPCVGLVQFLTNTQALGDYLNPAHRRYRPNDWTPDYCRSRIQDATTANELDVFLSVVEHFRPVFHHFLHENFSDAPASWLRAQLRYTRSVAVSSMVGYIVGLGDRHCSNILIDMNDFTLVHIDLGIAFDQGKLLKKPENVPFRLTRDIVDAMGVTGVEGVFRRTCELVLSVLRESQDSILTLIGVFKFDPLYKWSISSKKLMRADQSSSDSAENGGILQSESSPGNVNAERACHGVKQKLEGRFGGELLSVEGQVRKLIVDATSLANLATMFCGWSAFL